MLGSASQSAPSSSSVSNFMVDNYGSYGLQSCNPINSTFVSGSQPIHSEGVAAFNFATDGSTYRENGMSLDVGRLLQKGPRRDEEALSTILLSLKATGSDQDDNADDDILEDGKQEQGTGAVVHNISVGDSSGSYRSLAAKAVTVDELRRYFHLPIVEVSKQLGVCTTLLKRICRNNNIKKWPYRQICSIAKTIQSLEMASLNQSLQEDVRNNYLEQVSFLQKSLDKLIDDPSTPIDEAVEMVLNSIGESGMLSLSVFEGGGFSASGSWTGLGSVVNPSPSLLGPLGSDGLKPTAAEVIAAAVATAHLERDSSNAKSKSAKRKREELQAQEAHSSSSRAGAAGGGRADGTDASLHMPALGNSVVGHVVWNDGNKQRINFVPPIQLAALTRRKPRSASKKLVPLIEPDICNSFQIEFLPQTLLKMINGHHGTERFSSHDMLLLQNPMAGVAMGDPLGVAMAAGAAHHQHAHAHAVSLAAHAHAFGMAGIGMGGNGLANGLGNGLGMDVPVSVGALSGVEGMVPMSSMGGVPVGTMLNIGGNVVPVQMGVVHSGSLSNGLMATHAHPTHAHTMSHDMMDLHEAGRHGGHHATHLHSAAHTHGSQSSSYLSGQNVALHSSGAGTINSGSSSSSSVAAVGSNNGVYMHAHHNTIPSSDHLDEHGTHDVMDAQIRAVFASDAADNSLQSGSVGVGVSHHHAANNHHVVASSSSNGGNSDATN